MKNHSKEMLLNNEKYIVSIEHISTNADENCLKKLILRIFNKQYKNTSLERWTDPNKFVIKLSESGLKRYKKDFEIRNFIFKDDNEYKIYGAKIYEKKIVREINRNKFIGEECIELVFWCEKIEIMPKYQQ